VLDFLHQAAIKNIEKTQDYTPSWQHTIDITRICTSNYREDVDLFASGIRHLSRILNRGNELYNQRNIIELNGKEIPVSEWVRRLRTRIIWIGQEVIDHPLAFERVIVESIHHLRDKPNEIFQICYFLCRYAQKKGEEESLEKGLHYFIPWCKANNVYEKCKEFEE